MRSGLALLLALACCGPVHGAPASWLPADGEHLQFTLTDMKDRAVGTLVYAFARSDDGSLTVTRRERMSVKKFLIKADIDQHASEHWVDGRLHHFDAVTTADTSLMDETIKLWVARDAQGDLLATANDDTHELPGDAWPLTLWHSGFAEREQFFATAGGDAIRASVSPGALDTVPADGGQLACQSYTMEGEADGRRMTLQAWYDAAGRLCRLRSDSGFGPITYTRVQAEETR